VVRLSTGVEHGAWGTQACAEGGGWIIGGRLPRGRRRRRSLPIGRRRALPIGQQRALHRARRRSAHEHTYHEAGARAAVAAEVGAGPQRRTTLEAEHCLSSKRERLSFSLSRERDSLSLYPPPQPPFSLPLSLSLPASSSVRLAHHKLLSLDSYRSYWIR
jgi:hypothetical protein